MYGDSSQDLVTGLEADDIRRERAPQLRRTDGASYHLEGCRWSISGSLSPTDLSAEERERIPLAMELIAQRLVPMWNACPCVEIMPVDDPSRVYLNRFEGGVLLRVEFGTEKGPLNRKIFSVTLCEPIDLGRLPTVQEVWRVGWNQNPMLANEWFRDHSSEYPVRID